jgi:hypothetical protein
MGRYSKSNLSNSYTATISEATTTNTTTIASNSLAIDQLETELKTYTDSKVAGLTITHGFKIIALETLTQEQATTISNLETLIEQQPVQINELITFVSTLQGNT